MFSTRSYLGEVLPVGRGQKEESNSVLDGLSRFFSSCSFFNFSRGSGIEANVWKRDHSSRGHGVDGSRGLLKGELIRIGIQKGEIYFESEDTVFDKIGPFTL